MTQLKQTEILATEFQNRSGFRDDNSKVITQQEKPAVVDELSQASIVTVGSKGKRRAKARSPGIREQKWILIYFKLDLN